ncbi:MAG: helix-turn-helix domain-containing protein [Limisphaerales bacterium]
MHQAQPERISQARELSGLSKTELAELLNVSVPAVAQWENGAKNPTAENVLAISQVLRVPMGLLMSPMPPQMHQRGPITFRARASAKTAKLSKQAQRLAEIVAEAFLWLEQHVEFPVASLPEIPDANDAEGAASACRRFWGLGDLPISKLGELVESKGIRLCLATFGDLRFDAYSCTYAGRRFIFLGTVKEDRARSRFDTAHELAHLVLHQHLTDDDIDEKDNQVEDQANAFASAFLLPRAVFSQDLVDTSLEGFKRLKSKWGVSIQAMVRRARDLELISEQTYLRHCRTISARGWRGAKAEPLDEVVPRINRSLGPKAFDLLKEVADVPPWELADAIPLPSQAWFSVFGRRVEEEVPRELRGMILRVDFGAQSQPRVG